MSVGRGGLVKPQRNHLGLVQCQLRAWGEQGGAGVSRAVSPAFLNRGPQKSMARSRSDRPLKITCGCGRRGGGGVGVRAADSSPTLPAGSDRAAHPSAAAPLGKTLKYSNRLGNSCCAEPSPQGALLQRSRPPPASSKERVNIRHCGGFQKVL